MQCDIVPMPGNASLHFGNLSLGRHVLGGLPFSSKGVEP